MTAKEYWSRSYRIKQKDVEVEEEEVEWLYYVGTGFVVCKLPWNDEE
jgi:hypothetical protein